MDLGETLGRAAIRETLEETGIETELTGISGIYTDPKHVLDYTSNGEVRQEFSGVFTTRYLSGEPTPSDESSHVEWVARSDIGYRLMHPSPWPSGYDTSTPGPRSRIGTGPRWVAPGWY